MNRERKGARPEKSAPQAHKADCPLLRWFMVMSKCRLGKTLASLRDLAKKKSKKPSLISCLVVPLVGGRYSVLKV